uniref:Methylenetetrahydrofolate reductase (NAD(P)H) n=1 Tax=Anopheles coluzzii TaxID=1518534 RepID=A0A8W7P5T3_ANOCL
MSVTSEPNNTMATTNTVTNEEQSNEHSLRTKLDRIFNSSTTSGPVPVHYSIEIAAKDDFDIGQLKRLTPQPVFCALPWVSDDNLRYADDFLRSPTLQLTARLRENQFTVLNNVSCYNITEQQVDQLLRSTGIRNLFVIRGDTVSPGQQFRNSAGLVQHLRKWQEQQPDHRQLTIAVGGYPYGHYQSSSQTEELHYLQAKISQGADFLLTQTLYDAPSFLRYRDRCREAGITIPIIPGIYVPHSYRHLQALLNLTRIELGPTVRDAFEAHANDAPDQFQAFMVEYFVGVVRELLQPNATTSSDPIKLVHFFTFNKFHLLQQVLEKLDEFFK